MQKITFLYVLIFLLITGCAHVNYIGKSYQPTKKIDIYFSEADTKRDFEVIGHAISGGQLFVSVDELQEKLIMKAKHKGADAIIITGIGRDMEEDGHGFDAEKQVKATFIKYKDVEISIDVKEN